MTGSNTIVSFNKIFETRDNMDGFSLTDNHVLSWLHFDPGQGLTINIVYYAAEQSSIKVSGYAVKSKEIRLADNQTLGFFDKRVLWITGRAMLIFISFSIGGKLSNSLIKKRLRASLFEAFFGVIGMSIELAAFFYIVFLIGAGSHIEYAPF